MTPERFRECLDAIGWTGRELARRLEVDERQVRRWSSGSEMPQRVADWVETLAQVHEANPPPSKGPRRVPPPKIEWDRDGLPPADRREEIEAIIQESFIVRELGASPSLFNGRVGLERGDYVMASGEGQGLVLTCTYYP